MDIESRARPHKRITDKMTGTADKPRLVVFRSNNHMYAQVVDDAANRVLAVVSTNSKDFKAKEPGVKTGNKDAAAKIGKLVAAQLLAKGIKEVCFDRAGYKYHGRVKALADSCRQGGIKF